MTGYARVDADLVAQRECMYFYHFVLGMTGILSGLTVLVTSIILRYRAKARGLNKAASRQELEEIRTRLTALGNDMHGVQETLADLTLMLDDRLADSLDDTLGASREPQLTPGDDGL
jgi:hypothetical protein